MFAETLSADSIGLGGLGLAAVGAAFGVVASMWGRAKSLFVTISGLAVRRVELPGEHASRYVGVLVKRYRVSSNYIRVYSSAWYVSADGDFTMRAFPFEILGKKPMVFWRGWWPMLFFPSDGKGQDNAPRAVTNDGNSRIKDASEPSDTSVSPVKLVYLRGTFDIDQISRWFYESQHRETKTQTLGRGFYVYRISKDGENVIGSQQSRDEPWYASPHTRVLSEFRDIITTQEAIAASNALPGLVLSPALQSIVDDVGRWLKSRRWYVERHITWKRGFLFFGPPGTGKTAMVRALGHAYQMPVFVFELAGVTDVDFRNKWGYVKSAAPAIALFEDFDNVFHGRTNITTPNYNQTDGDDEMFSHKPSSSVRGQMALRFDTLINAIDGIEPCDGVLLVVTTNEVDKIDPALGQPVGLNDTDNEFVSTRPGRIDRVFRLGAMSLEDKIEMARRMFVDDPQGAETTVSYLLEHGATSTPAQVRERCAQDALLRYWQRQEKEGRDAPVTDTQ